MSVETPSVPKSEHLSLPEQHRNAVSPEILHNKEFVIGLYGESVYNPEDIGLPPNSGYAIMAEIQMGHNEEVGTVAVIRQQSKPKDNFMLASLSKNPIDPDGPLIIDGRVCDLREGFSVQLGRQPDEFVNTPEAEDFVFGLNLGRDSRISRQHVTVNYENDRIKITDTSSNGTKLRALGYKQAIDTHDHEHTGKAEDEARLQGYLLETLEGKRFDGRIPVGRDTTIDGADAYVDIRSWVAGGEAIVIDSKKYPEEFQKLLATYNQKYSELSGSGLRGEQAKIKAIFDAVSATLNYDLDFVNKTSEDLKDNPKRKVALNYYLEAGKGVCRHMGLAVAWLGGELARHGVIEGTMTAEVNQRRKDNAAHEWARYTAKDGTVYILDPAQEYFGTLSESLNKTDSWEYFRPGERMRYEALGREMAVEGNHIAVSGISRLIGKLHRNKSKNDTVK